MRTVFYLFFVLLLGVSSRGYAQKVSYAASLEIPVSGRQARDFLMYSLKEKGIVVVRESFENARIGTKFLIIQRLDTALNTVWQQPTIIDANDNVVMHDITQDAIYLLVEKGNYEYLILKIAIEDGNPSGIEYQKMFRSEIEHFRAIHSTLLLGGESEGSPFVIHLDIAEKKQKLLPLIYQKEAEIVRLDMDTLHSQIVVITSGKVNRQKSTHIQTFDTSGQLLNKKVIEDREEYQLLSFRPYFKSASEMLLLGAYSVERAKKPQGIYAIGFNGEEETFEYFYDFIYLKNFFNYLPPKRRQKLIDKTLKAKQEGKNRQYDVDLFLDEIQQHGNQLVLSANAYSPIYSNSANSAQTGFMPSWYYPSYYSRWYSGRYMPYYSYYYNRSMFNTMNNNNRSNYRFRFREANFFAFTENGKLLWDNSFSYNDVEAMQPFGFMGCLVGDSLQVLQCRDDKWYVGNSTLSGENSELSEFHIYTNKPTERITNQENENLLNWYGNYFIFGAYQTIRDIENDEANRKVIAFYKIALLPKEKETNSTKE